MLIKPIFELRREIWDVPTTFFYMATGGFPRFRNGWHEMPLYPHAALLMSGIFEKHRVSRVGHDILEKNGVPCYVPRLFTGFGDIVEYAGIIEKRIEKLLDRHEYVSLIGYSLGGLIALCLAPKYQDRIGWIFTIATPVLGSDLAEVFSPLFPRGSVQQMRVGSVFLRETVEAVTKSPVLMDKIVHFVLTEDGVVRPDRCVIPGVKRVHQVCTTHLKGYRSQEVFSKIGDMILQT